MMFLTFGRKNDKLHEYSEINPSEQLYHPLGGPFTVTPTALSTVM
jgi:hypothetical protein